MSIDATMSIWHNKIHAVHDISSVKKKKKKNDCKSERNHKKRKQISIVMNTFLLTLKVRNKNCSGRHFNFLLLSFEENKA